MFAISYAAAKHLDNIQNVHLLIMVSICLMIVIIALCITIIVPGWALVLYALALVGLLCTALYAISLPSHMEQYAKQELSPTQRQLENLQAKRMEAIHRNAKQTDIDTLNQQIAHLQVTINHYNHVIDENN